MRNVLTAVILISISMASGCAMNGLGQEDFSCDKPIPGLACIDSMTVYEITNDPELRDALVAELTRRREAGEEVDPYAVLAELQRTMTPETGMVKSIVEPIRQAKPILKPAKVVRIWVAPWVDQKGDLHMPGYVFSEVTPRRWELGEPETGTSAILAPVQMEKQPVNP